ncbi:MAG: DUF11 domain-containing protein [Candidatus Auribacter fodinae]|uniref:DUF11 domain-containing protein n=1 Tax=Candidatus Auribacter fodinae TaxID=2093366 RepID=A0A3A4RFA7_9BACT|nr:MAG: DUF11 domain-containing protein [Candidatus Auribacter fodinae]
MKLKLASKLLLLVAMAATVGLSGCCLNCEKEAKAAPKPEPKKPMMNYNWLAHPTADKPTSMVLLEKMGPQTVIQGQDYDYTLKVTNLTNYKLEHVVVTEKPNDKFKIKSAVPPVTKTTPDGDAWDLGILEPNETKTITVTATATGTGTCINCAKVTYDPLVCIATNIINPQLALDLDVVASAMKCDIIPATFVVSNPGSGAADNVNIVVSLPANLMTADGKSSFTIPAGSLASGQSQRFTQQLKAGNTGNFTVQATAKADGGLEASDQGKVAVSAPALSIDLSAPDKEYVTKTITYDITVKNTGDAVAKDAVVRLSGCGVAVFQSASMGGVAQGQDVVWNLGSLNANESKSMTVTLLAQQKGACSAKATATAYCADAASASATTDLLGIPALLLEVVDLEDPVRIGDMTTYVITVTNQGSATANNILIKTTLEANMEYVTGEGETKVAASGKTVNFAALPTLAPKAQAVWRVQIKAKESGDVRFSVEMQSDELKRPVTETESTNLY